MKVAVITSHFSMEPTMPTVVAVTEAIVEAITGLAAVKVMLRPLTSRDKMSSS
jgi:hypothetical protein